MGSDKIYLGECICVEALEGGFNRIILSEGAAGGKIISQWDSRYSVELIRRIYEARGWEPLIDEIRRDEDPLYVQACLEKDVFGYVSADEFRGKRLLDFGCGSGASTMILARMLPETTIVGVELNEKAVDLGRARAEFYGFEHVSFMRSPSGDELPEGVGMFDFIVLSAVFEHMLPEERVVMLPKIWGLLKPGGILFLDQTPWRWFPYEGHSSGLLGINYLGDGLAHKYAFRWSKRGVRGMEWRDMLRNGIRGGTVGEIRKILDGCSEQPCEILTPGLLGMEDRVDLWWRGYAVSIERNHPKVKYLQLVLWVLFKFVSWTTGLIIVPSLSLAIKKKIASS